MKTPSGFSTRERLLCSYFKPQDGAAGFFRSSFMRILLATTMLFGGIIFPQTAKSGSIEIRADATANVYWNWILSRWVHGSSFQAGSNGSTLDELAWVQFPLTETTLTWLGNREISSVHLKLFFASGSSDEKDVYITDLNGANVGCGVFYGSPSSCDAWTLADDISQMCYSSAFFKQWTVGSVTYNDNYAWQLENGKEYLEAYLSDYNTRGRVLFGLGTLKDRLLLRDHQSGSYAPMLTIFTRLKAPTGVSASDGTYTDKVRVTWNSSSGATGYEVWRHTSNSSGSATKIGDPTSTSYDDTTAVAGTTYYYWVKAVDSENTKSAFSSSNSGYRQIAPPVPPTGVSATDGGSCSVIRIIWNSVSGATGYEVWRYTSNNSGSATKMADVSTTYYDDEVGTGKTYYYWFKAKNTAGSSGFSTPDSGYTDSLPEETANVQASDGSFTDRVRIT